MFKLSLGLIQHLWMERLVPRMMVSFVYLMVSAFVSWLSRCIVVEVPIVLVLGARLKNPQLGSNPLHQVRDAHDAVK